MSSSLNLHQDSHIAALALIHPVKPGRDEQLRQVLQQLGHKDITAMQGGGSIDAMQWIMFDNHTRLLCTIHFYGTVDTLFQALATHGAERCRQIWGNCVGYPDDRDHTSADIAAYLAGGKSPSPHTFQVANVGATGRPARPLPLEDLWCQNLR